MRFLPLMSWLLFGDLVRFLSWFLCGVLCGFCRLLVVFVADFRLFLGFLAVFFLRVFWWVVFLVVLGLMWFWVLRVAGFGVLVIC